MNRRTLAAAAVLSLAIPAASFAEDTVRTDASATFGASITKGNTDTERYNLSADYRRRAGLNRAIANLELNRGYEDGERDVNNSRAATRYDRFLTDQWYLNTNATVFQDRKRDLRNRTTIGAGAGYQFFDRDDLSLSAEAGPAWQRDELLPDNETTDDTVARWALDYRQYFNDGSVRLFHNHEIVMDASDTSDWIATTRTGVRVPLRGSLTGALQFNYDYENETTAESRYDSTTLVTLNYDW